MAAVALFATVTWAKVWPVVYCYDEKTLLEVVDANDPIVYRDIMVGTRLTIIIRSDQTAYFCGCLVMSWDDIVYGDMVARGTHDKFWNWADSCLYDSGSDSRTWRMDDSYNHGFQFISTEFGGDPRFRDAVPGDWFIVDYHALQAGSCTIDFHDNTNVPVDTYFYSLVPMATLSFHHVPTRDFNADRVVDLRDFAMLASRWQSSLDADPNSPVVAMDLDASRRIDVNDLTLFSDFWLERTDAPKAADPNQG